MDRNVSSRRVGRRISVDGIGGVFLYANDAKALSDWYAAHLGIKLETYAEDKVYGTEFKYRRLGDSSRIDATVWSISTSKVPLPPERRECVINYRVRDLPAFLDQLRLDGVPIEKTEEFEYGKFAWIVDPEGNRIELFEPIP